MLKRVLIIQQIIPEYRQDFFNLLKTELEKNNIELTLVYGNKSSSFKSGNQYSMINWGNMIVNKIIHIRKIEFCWQPALKYAKSTDLIITEQANRLIINYILMLLKYLWGNKLAFWGHGKNMQKTSTSFTNKFALKYLKKCDWWFAYTKSVKEYLERNKYPSNRITIVQNAINTNHLRNSLLQLSEDEIKELKLNLNIEGNNTAIFCGGMYPEKSIPFILRSCFIVKKQIPDFHILFIGSGVDADKVKEAANTHSWIHYLGTIEGRERIKYFKISAIQLMPGEVGLGILDSFALETPIITTLDNAHGPEIEYLENGKNGIITANELEEYSQRIINVLKNEEYFKLIEGCKNSASVLTVEKMVQNFKNGILQCLDRSN